MGTLGTADNNQTTITRANAGDTNVTTVNVGDNNMQPTDNNVANNQVLSRDTSSDYNVNALGDQSQIQRSINSNLTYEHDTLMNATGYDIHGQVLPGVTQGSTSTTFATDTAANDSRGDSGNNFQRRGNTISTNTYDAVTQ